MSIDTFLSLWLVCHRQSVWLHGRMTSFQGRKRTSERTEAEMRPWPSRKAILSQNAMYTPFSETRTPPEATRGILRSIWKSQATYYCCNILHRQPTIDKAATKPTSHLAAQPHRNHLISITLHLGFPWQNALPMNLTTHCCLHTVYIFGPNTRASVDKKAKITTAAVRKFPAKLYLLIIHLGSTRVRVRIPDKCLFSHCLLET
jgi:hypothetical protein